MDTEINKRWRAALRSGDYKQGQEALHRGDTFCCLGVLTDLYIKDHANASWVDSEYALGGSPPQYLNLDGVVDKNGYLAKTVMEWAGLDSFNPAPIKDGLTLASYNDTNYSFEQIANMIEDHL